jgi:hypothetical protein
MVVGYALTTPAPTQAQALELRWSGDELRFAAPKLHFLEGPLLDRLHSGTAVPLNLQLFVAADSRDNVVRRLTDRFILSYDLWEESIAVVPARKERPRTTFKRPADAESACLGGLLLKRAELPSGRRLWFKLEVRPDAPDEEPAATGTNLRGLVDILSRPTPKPKPELKWVAESGPYSNP